MLQTHSNPVQNLCHMVTAAILLHSFLSLDVWGFSHTLYKHRYMRDEAHRLVTRRLDLIIYLQLPSGLYLQLSPCVYHD